MNENISKEGLFLDEAVKLLLERVNKISDTERISLWNAHGRVLAQDVYAKHGQPPFPRSPLDGYAVQSEDIKGASRENPSSLRVLCEVDAGHVSAYEVTPKTAVRIMTGAPIPDGADCVVGQEDTDYGEEVVNIYEEIQAYENYCFQGEDYRAGVKILSGGTCLGAVEIGVLASLGCEDVCVYRKPRVAVITTGDETVLPGEELGAGKIYDSNLYTLVTRLRFLGAEISYKGRVGDNVDEACEALMQAADVADVVITTGGVSVGKKDIMHDVFRALPCERLFWRIAIKPGMPTLCGEYKGKLLVCLSGNPFGATVNLELLVRPLLAKLTGDEKLKIKSVRAESESAFPKASMVTRYVRAYYENGRVRIPAGSNASGILSSMCGCNCLIVIPAGTKCVAAGDEVEVLLL